MTGVTAWQPLTLKMDDSTQDSRRTFLEQNMDLLNILGALHMYVQGKIVE